MSKFLLASVFALAAIAGGCTTVRQLRDPVSLEPNGTAERTRTDDALDYSIARRIAAPPSVVWKVLTDAAAYPRWNSTVVSLQRSIALGSEIALVSKVAPDRTFELAVTTLDAPARMVWEDGGSMFLGVRNFTLRPADDGTTVFAMSETFSGAMLGMIEGSLPDFTPTFEAFAADLGHEAERVASTTAALP